MGESSWLIPGREYGSPEDYFRGISCLIQGSVSEPAFTVDSMSCLTTCDYLPSTYHRPRILFVIQAHSSGTHLTSLARTITADLEKMWDGATKPPELMNQSLADYFDFEFESMPHLMLAPDHYNRRASSLRQRFVDQERGDYIFKRAHPNTIPADGLELYMTMAWVCTNFL